MKSDVRRAGEPRRHPRRATARAAITAALVAVATAAGGASTASAAALPHDFEAEAPQISNVGVHRGGEFVYQDYVLDDHGANVDGLNRTDAPFGAGYEPGNPLDPFNPGSSGGQIRHAGEYFYPGTGSFYLNSADLVDFRVAPTADALVYEFRLNALGKPGDAVVGMCVDEDRLTSTNPVGAWPLGANVKATAGLGCDRLYTVFGTGAKLTTADGTTDLPAEDVRADTDANTLQLRVPYSVANPGRATWRYTVASGLWDGDSWTAVTPSPSRPGTLSGGDPTGASPQIYDLLSNNGETNSYWREEIQANDLKAQNLGSHNLDVDFGGLVDGRDDPAPQPTGVVQRLYRAEHRVEPGEGITVNNQVTRNYTYHGDDQPYTVVLPSSFYSQLRDEPGKRFRFDQCLHPLNGNHNVEVYYQQVAALPRTTPTPTADRGPGSRLPFSEFERRINRQNVVYACVNGRSENVGYTGGIGTVDAKEVQREVEKHYPIDPDKNILHGISLGSIGTWYMAMLDPDRYAGTVNAIFTPGFGTSNARLKNLLHVPSYMAIGSGDEFGQAAFADGISDQHEALGNEYVYEQLITREHELSIEHEILPFTERLIYPRVRKTNPARVRYQEDPARYPKAIPTDGAVYWVSGMKPRKEGTPADIDVTSLARADELPTVRTTFQVLYENTRLGRQSRFRGQFNVSRGEFERMFKPEEFEPGWAKIADESIRETKLAVPAVANGFELTSANLGEAAFDTRRMKLDTGEVITGRIKGDGPQALSLLGDFAPGTTATYDGAALPVERTAGGIRFAALETAGADGHTLVVRPGPRQSGGSQPGGGGQGQGPGGQAPGPTGTGTGTTPGATGCDPTAGFRSVSARGRGAGLRIGLTRAVAKAATVDVFQVSQGRRILGERRVARFTNRTGSFTWNGRGKGGSALRDGYYFVRLSVPTPRGRDTRRITLRRSNGRFAVRPSFYGRASCGLLRSFKLSRPVFGPGGRPLGISYRLGEEAQVSVEVRRGTTLVQRFPTRTRAGLQTFRLRLGQRARRSGDYRVRITVRKGGRTATSTLTGRRL